jgi:hypothetical protein
MAAFDAAMPGSRSRVAPFLQQLPGLQSAQKAAAVNLGIFPDASAGSATYAYAPALPAAPNAPASDRLASVDQLVRAPAVIAPPAPQPTFQSAPPVQMASAPPVQRQALQARSGAASVKPNKVWLQLASGQNPDALPNQFKRLKSRNKELFEGITGYVAKGPDRARLVVGPFRGSSDAQIFADDLSAVGIDSFSWTNSPSDTLEPLGTE